MTLRSIGSKGWLASAMQCLLPQDTTELVSPFFGSGKLEYWLMKRRLFLWCVATEIFAPLAALHWRLQSGDLQDDLEPYLGIQYTKEELNTAWAALREKSEPEAIGDVAVTLAVLLHNIWNEQLGHWLPTTPMGTVSIGRLERYCVGDRLNLRCSDGLELLRSYVPRGTAVAYVDPPPYREAPFSNKYWVTPEDPEAFHQELADILRDLAYPWALSVDDTPCVRELYRNHDAWCLEIRRSKLLILSPKTFWPVPR